MIKGNMFDVFAIRFSDGQEFSMIAKDADKAYALAEDSFPEKTIVKVWQVTNDDHDNLPFPRRQSLYSASVAG